MSKKISVLILSVAIIFAGVWTYTKAEGGEISVCVKKSGLVYVIGSSFRKQDCKKNDSLLSWNVAGPQGPKGDKGDPGPSLHLFDANDQDLGVLIGTRLGVPVTVEYIAFLPAQGLKIAFSNTGLTALFFPVNLERNVAFEGNDCNGNAYVTHSALIDQQTLFHLEVTGKISGNFKIKDLNVEQVVANSFISNHSCINTSEATTTYGSFEEVTLPFSLPLAGPLEIREQ